MTPCQTWPASECLEMLWNPQGDSWLGIKIVDETLAGHWKHLWGLRKHLWRLRKSPKISETRAKHAQFWTIFLKEIPEKAPLKPDFRRLRRQKMRKNAFLSTWENDPKITFLHYGIGFPSKKFLPVSRRELFFNIATLSQQYNSGRLSRNKHQGIRSQDS